MEDHLLTIARELEVLETRLVSSPSLGLYLKTEDAADYKRLALEAKTILDEEFGPLNNFSTNLLMAANSVAGGMTGGPSKASIVEARKIIEGAINQLRRRRNSGANRGTIDSTTGLLDRKAFDTEYGRLVSDAQAEHQPLGLVFVDVDRFKKVNDEHGHQRGDQVLAEVAKRISSCCKGKVPVYRYGGEEIVIALPNHDLNESMALAERCRVSLEREPIAGLTITASFGVSQFPDLAISGEQLIETADAAMYDAKNRGRNLVRYHGEPAPEPAAKAGMPSRKAPEPGRLTEDQLKIMRQLHFRHRAVECPNDGAYMKTHEINQIGQATTTVIAHCPQCGLQVEF